MLALYEKKEVQERKVRLIDRDLPGPVERVIQFRG